MSWFSKFFKNEDEFDVNFPDKEFPGTTVVRWFIYDTGIGNENDVAESVGLSRVSEEGDAKEKEDSDLRLIAIKQLFPYIDYMSTISADVIASAQLKILKESPSIELAGIQKELEDDLQIMRDIYQAVAASTLLGAISIAIRLGVLEQGGVALTEIDLEGDSDEY